MVASTFLTSATSVVLGLQAMTIELIKEKKTNFLMG
jgi:hypothetical protein